MPAETLEPISELSTRGTIDSASLYRVLRPPEKGAPQNLIVDNAYDSDWLDAELRFYGIELIAHIAGIEEVLIRTDVA